MNDQLTTTKTPPNGNDNPMGHVLAVAAGVVLMIAGVGMGVTIVLLPLGIPVGFAGLGVFLWGLFGRSHHG